MTNEFEEPDIDVPTPDEVETEMLIRGDLKEDARQIPQDKVTSEERRLIRAYLNDYLAEEDYSKLRELLRRYRPAIMEHQPEQTLENVEENYQHNQREKRFLDILKQQKQEKTITMNYPLDDGGIWKLRLGIRNTNSQEIEDLQTNFKLFEDLTPRENRIRNKSQYGQQLTKEEQHILESVQEKVNKKVNKNLDAMMIEFLSTHTYLLDEESDYNYMKEIYENMDKVYREQLYIKISQISGLVNSEIDELFQ